MKEYIEKLVDSIEGYGNILVTKPNGDTKKYPFTNTITDHFRKNMMYTILYGDSENENDPTNKYYYSNKMLAYRFKVTVGPETGNGSVENSSLVKDGSANQLTFAQGDAGDKSIGESRIARVGSIDTNQALISSAMGNSPYHVATGLQEELKGFDFSQQVFVGMQSVGAGQTAPLFRAARENIRWLKGSDSSWQRLAQESDVNTGYDADNGNAGSTKILNNAIDSPAARTAYWDSYTDEEFGVQATIRQTLGASTWKVATWKLLREDKEDEIEKMIKAWYVATHEVLPDFDDFKKDNVSLLWHNGEKFIITNDFYESNFLPGKYSEFFNENTFELQDPEGANYWSFIQEIDQWTATGQAYAARNVDNMIGNARTKGKILAIEVQNFIGADDEVGQNTKSAETLAYHIPTTNPIKIDRNDNVTVEYNFKFTKPTTSDDTSLQWNIAYIDNLARAINPVGEDWRTGLNSQYSNRATPIQLTGAAVFEKSILEERDSDTIVAKWKQLQEGDPLIGTRQGDSLRNYPTKDSSGLVQWKKDDWYAESTVTKKINVPAAPSKIARKAPMWGGTSNNIDNSTIIVRLSNELDFWRIWTSRTSDLWTTVAEDGASSTYNDFTNYSIYSSGTAISSSDLEDYENSRRSVTDTGNNTKIIHNLYKIDNNTVRDRRSYNSQVEFTPCFKQIIEGVVDNVNANNFLWAEIDEDNPLNGIVGNHFDYFKHMISDRDDNTFILSLSGNTWTVPGAYNNIDDTALNGQRIISALNFNNRRCQIWITPYGDISDNILRHAAKTNWIKDTNYYLPNGDKDETEEHAQSMLNVDTLWQNGIRMVNSEPGTTFTSQEAISSAVSTLSPATTKVGNDTYIVRDQGNGENEFQSKIDFKVTSDSRFISPPRFFKVMYGETGHFVDKDLQDNDTVSKWLLRDDRIDLMSEKFGNLRELDTDGNPKGLPDDAFFNSVYGITLYKDEKGTEAEGHHYLHKNIKVKGDIMELIDQIRTDNNAIIFDDDSLPSYDYIVREGDNYIGKDNGTGGVWGVGDSISIETAKYVNNGYGGHDLYGVEHSNGVTYPLNDKTSYSKGEGWKVGDKFWIQSDPRYVDLLATDDQPPDDPARDGGAGIELNFMQKDGDDSTKTMFKYSDVLDNTEREIAEDAMGNLPPQTEYNIKPGTGNIPYASTVITLDNNGTDTNWHNLDYGDFTAEKIKDNSIVRYTFGQTKTIVPNWNIGDTVIISDNVSGVMDDLRSDPPIYYGGIGREDGQPSGFSDESNYASYYFGDDNWALIMDLLESAERGANEHFHIVLPSTFNPNKIGEDYISKADAELKHNHTTEQIGDSFVIEYEIPAGQDKRINIADGNDGILGKSMLDSYDMAPGQVTGIESDLTETWQAGQDFTLLYEIISTQPTKYVWKKNDTYAIEGLHEITLVNDISSRNMLYGSQYTFKHNWVLDSDMMDARGKTPSKNEFVYIDPSADTPNPHKWGAIEEKERIILYDDIGPWCDKHDLGADDRTFNAIPLDDFIWNYTYNDDVAPFNIYSYMKEDGSGSYTYETLYKGSDNNLQPIASSKPTMSQTETMADSLSPDSKVAYNTPTVGATALNTTTLGADVHPEIQEMYNPYAYQGYTSFALLRSMVMKHRKQAALPTTITGWDSSNSDRESEIRTLANWYHPTNNPLGASLESTYGLVKTELDKFDTKVNWDDGTNYRAKDEILLALIRFYAPFGMMDLYFWDDQTPDRMTLSFPDPKQDMFYGLIANPGGDDDSMSEEPDNPTWTQGDKVELSWVINPPVTGSV